ncbi:cysteine desulfurase [Ligilactobacillus salitolerans]|uniref:Cysteine desulfurase n=1 Tax=Ligilactobacillus salitolerans TaxID=1808352 RepID=A0A401IQY6_9LACO|nr:cysteine desulfurase [Ligilactobacillus salitolerans]GBG93933.1 cysteine desulfurase [Ligilactobacillus salitolerans]
MAATEKNRILGDTNEYSLAAGLKKYALRDAGFREKKAGKFQLERALDPNVSANVSLKLKIVVDADLKKFKMSTTTANGLKEVNIFKTGDIKAQSEQLGYLLHDLQERNIITLV